MAAISPGEVADTVGEAEAAAERLGYPVVVKAKCKSAAVAKPAGSSSRAPGQRSPGTPPASSLGHQGPYRPTPVDREGDGHRKEYYASFTLDRSAKLHLAMVSARGGSTSSKSWRRTRTRSRGFMSTRSTA